ncbi:intermembrane lipid transfer protein VPS13A-like isoform X3 [Marmota flaviventris]|uniref:intermembrane lipid transfer protein VPS13A-like isoform X3 n=1 Tax=Marmota flaviventris TaxID=93162 RepID=UPI003A8B3F61
MQTTDQYWVPYLQDETEKLVRKLIRLDNLFAYWNVQSQMFYLNDYDKSLDNLKNGVVNEYIVPKGYDFVFRPISAKAKLQMNRRSDFDFSDPKINLEVELHSIAIEFNKPQYFSVMELLESVEMMTQNLPYRKFKPDVPLHFHAKEWNPFPTLQKHKYGRILGYLLKNQRTAWLHEELELSMSKAIRNQEIFIRGM